MAKDANAGAAPAEPAAPSDSSVPPADGKKETEVTGDELLEAAVKGDETKTPPSGDEPETPPEGEQPPEGEEGKEPKAPEGEQPEGEEGDEPTDPKEANRRGYAERVRIRSAVTKALDQVAQPQTADQLVEEGMDPALAEVEALKQDIQRRDVINYVTDLNSGLTNEAESVLRDFPVFDDQSPEYDQAFEKKVENLWKQAAGFRTDPSGQFVVNANIGIYDFYAAFAQARGSGVKAGAVKGQKAAEKMLAAAETPGSGAPPPKGDDDPFLRGLTGKSES